jgi:hypothetical protein
MTPADANQRKPKERVRSARAGARRGAEPESSARNAGRIITADSRFCSRCGPRLWEGGLQEAESPEPERSGLRLWSWPGQPPGRTV